MNEENASRTFMVGHTQMPARPLEPALYLVATPIGNLGDITLRALETLAAADLLACEDTRVTRVLLDRYGLRRRTLAYHEHNAAETGPQLLAALDAGRSVALVSDAGTPLVSDPGFRLVEQAIAAGHRVVPIPGPSALLAALSASGLPTDTFLFAGFLSARDAARRSRLEELRNVPATLVFFESPHRLGDALAAMHDALGDRPAAVCRELTKLFEETQRGSLSTLRQLYADRKPKGEIVVCVGPPAIAAPLAADDIDAMLLALAQEMPASKAAAEAAKLTGGRKQDLYRRLMDLRSDGGA